MGGEREKTLETKTKDANLSGKLRVHESGGHVHFHDDTVGAKIKASVPCGIWWKAWDALRVGSPAEPKNWFWIDPINHTSISIQVPDPKKKDALEVAVRLANVTIGDNYKALAEFTTR